MITFIKIGGLYIYERNWKKLNGENYIIKNKYFINVKWLKN